MSKPPFKVLGIEHVAIAVEDVETSSDFFGLLLGITYFDSIDGRRPTPEEPDAWDH